MAFSDTVIILQLGKRLEEGVGVVDVSISAHCFQNLHSHRDIILSVWHQVWILADAR